MANMLLKRIKDWETTITSFRTGDVIPVDGPSGTAKMSKDDLLRETAENALRSINGLAEVEIDDKINTYSVDDDGVTDASDKESYQTAYDVWCYKDKFVRNRIKRVEFWIENNKTIKIMACGDAIGDSVEELASVNNTTGDYAWVGANLDYVAIGKYIGIRGLTTYSPSDAGNNNLRVINVNSSNVITKVGNDSSWSIPVRIIYENIPVDYYVDVNEENVDDGKKLNIKYFAKSDVLGEQAQSVAVTFGSDNVSRRSLSTFNTRTNVWCLNRLLPKGKIVGVDVYMPQDRTTDVILVKNSIGSTNETLGTITNSSSRRWVHIDLSKEITEVDKYLVGIRSNVGTIYYVQTTINGNLTIANCTAEGIVSSISANTPWSVGIKVQMVVDNESVIDKLSLTSYPYEGKTALLFGDSFIEYGALDEAIKNALRTTNINKGYGGATCSQNSDPLKDLYTQIDGTSDTADVVVVNCTINDFISNKTLGAITTGRSERATYCGALHTIMTMLRTKYPLVPIVWVTPCHYSDVAFANDDTFSYATNTAGATLKDYVDKLKEIASIYNIKIADAYSASGIVTTGTQAKVNEADTLDGLHPSPFGASLIAKLVKQVLC